MARDNGFSGEYGSERNRQPYSKNDKYRYTILCDRMLLTEQAAEDTTLYFLRWYGSNISAANSPLTTQAVGLPPAFCHLQDERHGRQCP